MKGRAVVVFIVVSLVLCPFAVTMCTLSRPTSDYNQWISREFITDDSWYLESPLIHIQNNTDFSNQASAYSWDGNGSSSTPYIIEKINITTASSTLIQIGNTTVFFEIRGCLLVGGISGILLQNVTNAKVWNNTIKSMSGADSRGVYSIRSSFCELQNNTISDIEGQGILLDYSHNCSLTNNTLGPTGHDGIYLRDSSDNNITSNEITHSNLNGVKLGNSHRCRIEQNIVDDSLSDGIAIEASSSCIIANNVVVHSGSYSLDVAANSCDITGNTFYKSQIQGVRCQGDDNNLTKNNFIENNLGFEVFTSCLVDSGSNNNINGNYYDSWTWPDVDEDNIVDQPYPYGPEQSDPEPHVRVFLTELMHILTKPRLIYPNGTLAGEKFWGLIQLKWTVSSDTFGHDALYNVSVSADGGIHWSVIAQELTSTSFDWNASEFAEGTEYSFRVVAQCTDGLISEYTTGVEYEVRTHTLTAPKVLSPNGGETIFGTYDITWTEAVESWGLLVTYSVYYSSDAGDTWSKLIDSIEETTLVWDIHALPDGNHYLIQVVARGASGLVALDTSDSVFSISRPNVAMIGLSIVAAVVVVVIVVYLFRHRGAS